MILCLLAHFHKINIWYNALFNCVSFQTLQISAILDEEPEMDEQFIVTLFAPTGGARMGEIVQTLITVLQNQAPLGIFSIFPIVNRSVKAISLTLELFHKSHYLVLKPIVKETISFNFWPCLTYSPTPHESSTWKYM